MEAQLGVALCLNCSRFESQLTLTVLCGDLYITKHYQSLSSWVGLITHLPVPLIRWSYTNIFNFGF